MEILKNIFVCFGILLGISIIIMITMVTTVNFLLASKKGNNEKKISSKNSGKKALIVFQPGLSQATSKAAEQIAKGLNKGGYEIILNNPGQHLSTDISKFELVVFGSPTYGGQVSKVLTQYMSEIKDFSFSKVILFTTGLNANVTAELDTMESFLKNAKAYKKVKLNSAQKESKEAYELGCQLAKG